MRLRTIALFAIAALGAVTMVAPRPSEAAELAVDIRGFAFQPQTITVNQGDTVRWTNQDGVTHNASGTGWRTPNLASKESAAVTFDTAGTFAYICTIHSSMQGTVIVKATAPATGSIGAPSIKTPADNATLTNFQPLLTWQNPVGATQYHLQIIPANNDGPGVDLHVGSAGESFSVPPPPQWYGLLPGMTYTWRVRVSNAAAFVALDDPSWGEWSEGHFRTPNATSDGITPVDPPNGGTVSSFTPTITWANSQKEVFYYEFQLSKDPTFNTDPNTATASVYWLLLHGGVTTPANSYKVPANAQLSSGTVYYWRVRPRIQGDGTPVPWSRNFTLNTKTISG